MTKIPCKHCGQTKGGRFHSMEEMLTRYRREAANSTRRGDYDRASDLVLYLERAKYDMRSAGYDFHTFEQLTNLEYLEYKAKEDSV